MKVKELNQKEESFTPIKLEITIQSYDELCEFWHRTNITAGKLIECSSNNDYIKTHGGDCFYPLWKKLDEIAIKLNN